MQNEVDLGQIHIKYGLRWVPSIYSWGYVSIYRHFWKQVYTSFRLILQLIRQSVMDRNLRSFDATSLDYHCLYSCAIEPGYGNTKYAWIIAFVIIFQKWLNSRKHLRSVFVVELKSLICHLTQVCLCIVREIICFSKVGRRNPSNQTIGIAWWY